MHLRFLENVMFLNEDGVQSNRIKNEQLRNLCSPRVMIEEQLGRDYLYVR